MGSVRVEKGAIRYDLEAGARRTAAHNRRRVRLQRTAVVFIAGMSLAAYLVWTPSSRVTEPDRGAAITAPPSAAPPSTPAAAGTKSPMATPVPQTADRLAVDSRSPTLGTQRLDSGFDPNPLSVTGAFGGELNVTSMNLGPGCIGHSTAVPTWLLDWTGLSSRLEFSTVADEDTALVVRDPAGVWHCDDDSNDQNPVVTIANAQTGVYRVWATSFKVEPTSGTLSVTERDRDAAPAAAPTPSALAVESLSATLGSRRLDPGFEPNPLSIGGRFGGEIDVEALKLGSDCVGRSAAAPTLLLDWRGSSSRLELSVVAAEDTALVVRDPAGAWRCADDSDGQNPVVTMANAPTGLYRVWVTSYDGRSASGTLRVAERVTPAPERPRPSATDVSAVPPAAPVVPPGVPPTAPPTSRLTPPVAPRPSTPTPTFGTISAISVTNGNCAVSIDGSQQRITLPLPAPIRIQTGDHNFMFSCTNGEKWSLQYEVRADTPLQIETQQPTLRGK